ncbi:unnamed protein product [Rhizophagus irregularis]|nr:unnamed protein product [Rhizophagus irregularis]
MWKDGPLYYDTDKKEWTRESYVKVYLNCLYSLQDFTDEVINKIESYYGLNYGISQNPDTKDYILVFKIEYIKLYCKRCEMRLKINKPDDTIFEWIPYNKFINVKEIGDSFAKATWKDGPLYYDTDKKEWTRESYVKVYLNCLYSLQDFTDEVINKIESYYGLNYGISQNPDTKDYILVFKIEYIKLYCKRCGNKYERECDEWCKTCHINYPKNNFTGRTSGNEKIDDFIQKMPHYPVFEWIPYNEFINVKEIGNDCLNTAMWKDGPLYYDTNKKEWVKEAYEKVCLKYLHNLQDITDEVINKIKSYLLGHYGCPSYGISQNPDTKDYILVFKLNILNCIVKNVVINMEVNGINGVNHVI